MKIMKIEKTKLTTTLALLKKHGVCKSGYHTLRKSLGLKWPAGKPINLLHILKSNGVQDMLWCLCATREDCVRVRVGLCANFAESVLYHSHARADDPRMAECIETCYRFARGEATAEQLNAARSASEWSAAEWTARWSVGWSAAWSAAEWLARSARSARSAESKRQAAIIRKWLKP